MEDDGNTETNQELFVEMEEVVKEEEEAEEEDLPLLEPEEIKTFNS